MSFVNHFNTSTTVNGTSITLNVSGINANDIALLCFYGGGSSSAPVFPSGFSTIGSFANQNVSTADGTCTAAIRLKVCSGGEASFTVTWTGSNLATLVCQIYRGRNANTPVTASAQTTTSAGTLTGMGFTATITGVTAAAGDDIAVFVPYQQTTNGTQTLTFTAPTGYGNTHTDFAASTANSPGVGNCNNVNVSAGATGNLSATLNDNQGTSTGWISYVVSLAVSPPGALVGQTIPTSGGSGGSPNVNNAYTSSSGAMRCYAGGVVTQLNAYVSAGGTATTIYLALYDINGNLLCGGSTAIAAGLNTVSIASGPTLVYGASYWLVFQVDGTMTPADDGTAFHRNAIANTTLPLPATLAFPGSNINAGNYSMWAAGTLGAGAQGTPLGGPPRVQWHWRS